MNFRLCTSKTSSIVYSFIANSSVNSCYPFTEMKKKTTSSVFNWQKPCNQFMGLFYKKNETVTCYFKYFKHCVCTIFNFDSSQVKNFTSYIVLYTNIQHTKTVRYELTVKYVYRIWCEGGQICLGDTHVLQNLYTGLKNKQVD